MQSTGCAAQAKKAGEMGDNEQLRLAAEDAEFNRAKERLTLKHRNTSKWARRALKRGVNVTDEGELCSMGICIWHHDNPIAHCCAHGVCV